MSDEYLINLSSKPPDLRLDVLPILQKELLVRSLNKEALSITEFLVKVKEKPRFKDMTELELKQLIAQRIESGESIESIKIDLKDDGINIFDIINEDAKLQDKAIDYLTQLKDQGYQEHEIDEKLKETLSIEKEDTEQLKLELKKRGKQNLIIGYSIAVLAALMMFLSLSMGGNVTIGSVILIAIGIWRIYKGSEQLKK